MFARLYDSVACPSCESSAWICARTACTCWRFEAIDGSAVAGPIAMSRNAAERRQSRNEEWSRPPCEERHAASRSPVDRPADGGVTGHKSGSLAARSDVCTPTVAKISANSREFLRATVTGPVRGRGRYLVPCARPFCSSDRPPARRSARRSTLGARLARHRPALGRARAVRRRVAPRTRPRRRRTARVAPPCARCSRGAHPPPRDGRAQLARSDQRESRDIAPPAVRRRRARPDRRPPRGAPLPAILAGIDELERTTLVNRGIAAEARRALADAPDAARCSSASAATWLSSSTRREAAVATRERAATAQRATVDAIRRRAGVTRARLAAIREQAQAAQRASTRLTRSSAPALVPSTPVGSSGATRGPATPAPAAGTRSLVVDAVAYHLAGRTASGLPGRGRRDRRRPG